jgi:hypothetical protein
VPLRICRFLRISGLKTLAILCRMSKIFVAAVLICVGALSACTYDSLRMGRLQKCGRMPMTQANRCYERNEMTGANYRAEVAKLKQAARAPSRNPETSADPRYEAWLPEL